MHVGSAEPEGKGAVFVVFVTGPDRAALVEIGRRVVAERLAACANVWNGLTSVFRWEGEVQEEGESLALLKTTAARLEPLRDRILELHPYEEPEFLALAVDAGSPSYLGWVAESVGEG